MKDPILLGMAAIPSIGIFSQWLAAKTRLPSILLLLLAGFLVGPILNLISPDLIYGDTLYPIVSLSVALILFEGGLSLKFSDIKTTGGIVRNLIFIGGSVTWVGVSLAAYYFLGFDPYLAILLGAILTVSGPTVVTPLLRQIKLKHTLSSILRWEGIMIDPFGATLAVLVFEIILAREAADALGVALLIIFSTIITGFVLGFLSSFLIIISFKRRWVPDYLQEAFTFVVVLMSYSLSDMLQSESGLLTVTIMGVILANQTKVQIRHIVSFKENITVLLLSSLFILLAARVQLGELLLSLNVSTLLFIAALIFVIRPLSVFISSARHSSLEFKEKLLLSFIYPRGIVAAAVSSLFAIRLIDAGFEQAQYIVSYTFITIVLTVTFYGLLGWPVVRYLKLQRFQKGIVIAGAHAWAIQFAKALKASKTQVVLIDTNIENVLAAKEEGLNSIHASILSSKVKEDLEMSGYGKLLALTSSDETNLLSSIEYEELFGTFNVLRLFPRDKKKDMFIKHNESPFFLGKSMTFIYIDSLITAGFSFKQTLLTKDFTMADFNEKYPKAVNFCVIHQNGRVRFYYDGAKINPGPGSTIISLRR